MLTGTYPNVHKIRDPFSLLQAKSIAETLQEAGYKTAAFVGTGLLSAKHSFNHGFNLYDEPQRGEETWEVATYPDPTQHEEFVIGRWWVPDLIDWIKKNYKSRFFVWGHWYDTHEGAERHLLAENKLEEGKLSEFCYYDAKIKLYDEEVMGPILNTLEDLNIYDETMVIIMSDHGTTLGEHPAEPLPWRPDITYPQHTDMWDTDLRIAFVLKNSNFLNWGRVDGMIRSIDVVPTVLELLGISTKQYFDGISLIPFIKRHHAEGLVAYSEELYERRGPGAVQAIRTDDYKLMRNLNKVEEGFYNLKEDPGEQNNLIDKATESEKKMIPEWRSRMNEFLWKGPSRITGKIFSKEEREEIEARLRVLGYIK